MINHILNMKEKVPNNIKKRNMQAILGFLEIKKNEVLDENKNLRIQKSKFQTNVLKEVFKITKFPSKQTRDDLALLLNHTNRGIQIWFQNRRNSRDGKYKIKNYKDLSNKNSASKSNVIDILTLVDIIDENFPQDKKIYWDNFINHIPNRF